MINKITQFLLHDIWLLRIKNLPSLKRFSILHLRVLVLSIKGFFQDKCQLRSSALTFFTLMAIVPVLAFALGLAKGFGFDAMVESQIQEKMSTVIQPEAVDKLLIFAKNALESTKGGLIGGLGLLFLFWTVIKIIGHIESSLNEIWGIKKSRSFLRKIADYLSSAIVGILLSITAVSLNVYITAMLSNMASSIELLSKVSGPVFFLLKFSPYLLLWLALGFIYFFLPNTQVKFGPALMGGIVGGTVFIGVLKAYIGFQVGAAKYSAIYGSLAAIPLLLIWLQVSWNVVLFGAEIAFSFQNHEQFEYEMGPEEISTRIREVAALRITLSCVQNFCNELPPPSAEIISDALNIPIKIVRDILFRLSECGILSRICNGNETYQPAKDVEKLTITSIIETLRRHGNKTLETLSDDKTKQIEKALDSFSKLVKDSQEDTCLKSLI